MTDPRMTLPPVDLLACPRCDRTPLEAAGDGLRCTACKVDFPVIAGLPWLFAEPDATLAEWRGRLHMALRKIDQEAAAVARDLKDASLRPAARARTERFGEALGAHRDALAAFLEPFGADGLSTRYETYLALRTRLPTDQGLNTYYQNVHRDWSWGDEENAASVEAIRAVLGGHEQLGEVLVLGGGAGRLAYDLQAAFETTGVTMLDFNPLLALVARRMADGERFEFHEFPIAPLTPGAGAVLRELAAPSPAGDGFSVVLGDALRPPFAAGRFDTVVTPWLIDVIGEDPAVLAARINGLLADGGRWLNFGSLAFDSPSPAGRHSTEDIVAIAGEAGFDPVVSDDRSIPYMCSPASRHARRETVFTFAATKAGNAKRPARHRALPDWIVTGKEPVPLSPSFRTQAMSTQIYAFVMSLIDGKRSIEDMAKLFEQQQLMPRDEAVPAIRNFLIRMVDDSARTP